MVFVLILAVAEAANMRFVVEQFPQMGDFVLVPSESIADGRVPQLPDASLSMTRLPLSPPFQREQRSRGDGKVAIPLALLREGIGWVPY